MGVFTGLISRWIWKPRGVSLFESLGCWIVVCAILSDDEFA